jgi:hypothetical protein
LQTGNEQYKCFRSCISVRMLVFFILALATLQSLVVLISETSQNVYGQTQATVTDINNVGDLSWTSPSLDNNLKPTTSSVMISASIPDNGNNNTTPFLLPSPPSGQSSGNDSPPPADAGLASTPLASNNNNVLNSNSPPQGDNSNNNSTNNHHHSHSISQSNTVGINDNHGSDQHKNHKHTSTGDIINQIVSQSKQQFSGGQIPFP